MPPEQPQAQPLVQPQPVPQPAAGGSYTRDPVTHALTRVEFTRADAEPRIPEPEVPLASAPGVVAIPPQG